MQSVDFRTKTNSQQLPLVTIGVLSYNYSKYINRALESVLNQTYQNIELIIVDDCSTEDSADKIGKLDKSTVI